MAALLGPCGGAVSRRGAAGAATASRTGCCSLLSRAETAATLQNLQSRAGSAAHAAASTHGLGAGSACRRPLGRRRGRRSREARGVAFATVFAGSRSVVPLFVMLPLDTVDRGGRLKSIRVLLASLHALKAAGVTGVMVDVWWGIAEPHPCQYDFAAYVELAQILQGLDLKMQAVMSFHQCGGNEGDSTFIPLPEWLRPAAGNDSSIYYTDCKGLANPEYLSCGADELPLFHGRTPVQMYREFMAAFRESMDPFLGPESTVIEVEVGMGPCGELRYPSFPRLHGWAFPGIGQFQCYDAHMLRGYEAWWSEHEGPGPCFLPGCITSGDYNAWPLQIPFYAEEGQWKTPLGDKFLTWYSQQLLDHGARVLGAAREAFAGTGVALAGKVAGMHWWYRTQAHAAELTAGYYNTRYRDGYKDIAALFGRYGATLNFTCLEMRDADSPPWVMSSPESLVRQVRAAAAAAGVPFAGENALLRYDRAALEQVLSVAFDSTFPPLASFTFLRLHPNMLHDRNWTTFVGFVRAMRAEASHLVPAEAWPDYFSSSYLPTIWAPEPSIATARPAVGWKELAAVATGSEGPGMPKGADVDLVLDGLPQRGGGAGSGRLSWGGGGGVDELMRRGRPALACIYSRASRALAAPPCSRFRRERSLHGGPAVNRWPVNFLLQDWLGLLTPIRR